MFNYTDHLGNVRMSYGKDSVSGVLKITEENNYYAFGMKHKNYNMSLRGYGKLNGSISLNTCENCVSSYNYKYNGKELQNELGLNMYDYGARMYDPAAPRFWQMDPVAETSRRFSPYSYALDNPVYFIDRDGMYADTFESQNSGECCPGFPFGGKAPKETSPLGDSMQNFTPSDKTTNYFSQAKELLSNVIGYDASVEAGYSVSVDATVGPVKAGVDGTLGNISLETNEKNIIEGKVEGAGLAVNGKLGTATGEAKVTIGNAKVEINKKGNIKPSAEGATATASGTLGNKNKLSLSNSGTLAASIKIPTPQGISAKVGVSVNLYNVAVGTVKMVHGGVSYLSDYVSNYFSGN